jgi:hypothetical protein
MPVILATWEAEIWRLLSQSQPLPKVLQTTSQPMAGEQWLMPVIPAWDDKEADIRRIIVPGQHRQRSLQAPSQKKKI